MKEYKVKIPITGDAFVNIKAENEEEAIKIAISEASVDYFQYITEWFMYDECIKAKEINYKL
ncbi:TPA: hypothetical protein KQG29_001504 [Clostridioides difficile]|nr:hypothetical protein [Clostridioides difficile]